MSIAWEEQKEKAAVETQEFTSDPVLNQRIKDVCVGLQGTISKKFIKFPTDEDRALVAGFLEAGLRQESIKTNTKKTYILGLNYLSKYFDYKKSFKDMTDQDIADFLGSLHRNQDIDPDRTWINKHNTWASAIYKFYKWVAYPKLSPHERKRLPKEKFPDVLRQLHFVSKPGAKNSITKKHIWYDEDNIYFYKYCNHDLRLKFYHALAMDTAARPHELIALKIGDIEIKKDLQGRYYVPLVVGKHGKKKEGRNVGMAAMAVAFYREYLQKEHPDPNNPQAYLFPSTEYSAKYRNVPLSELGLREDYVYYKKKRIPALLKAPDSEVPPEDKKMLKHLQETKKWFPYNVRHAAITRLKKLGMDDFHLKLYVGWSKNSKMLDIYTHEQDTDALESAMLTLGIDVKATTQEQREKQEKLQQELQGNYCHFCGMVNVKDARFCSSCKFPLLIEVANEQREEAENTKKELEELKTQQQEFEEKIEETMTANFQKMQQEMLRMFRPDLKQIKNEKERNTKGAELLWNADVLEEYNIE